MNKKIAYEKLNTLSEEDLILFKANLHTGLVPMHIWESRMEIVQDLGELVTNIAKEKGFIIPPVASLMRIETNSHLDSDENLQKYLGISWPELETSYFQG